MVCHALYFVKLTVFIVPAGLLRAGSVLLVSAARRSDADPAPVAGRRPIIGFEWLLAAQRPCLVCERVAGWALHV